MRSKRQKVVAACDYSMHHERRQAKGSMYWWNDQLAALRRECLAVQTPGLDNADRDKYIVQSLFPHVKPFQRQD